MLKQGSYKWVQARVAEEMGLRPDSVKTCWIAEVKREMGLTGWRAHNSGQGKGAPPCPAKYRGPIKSAIRKYLG